MQIIYVLAGLEFAVWSTMVLNVKLLPASASGLC